LNGISKCWCWDPLQFEHIVPCGIHDKKLVLLLGMERASIVHVYILACFFYHILFPTSCSDSSREYKHSRSIYFY
jgi:lipoate-protein ligase B